MIIECPSCRLRYDVTGRPPNTRARCRCGKVFTLPDASDEASSLACPNCGGACAPTSTQCAFCNAALATVRCPRCFGRIFEGSKHCGHCGAGVDIPARDIHATGSTQLPCPRCSKGLVANLVGDVLIDQCEHCGGLWLDQSAFEEIIEARERQQKLSSALGQRAPAAAPSDLHKVVYLKCPECENIMDRRNFAKRSGVIIDVCGAHGAWFDRDELPNIIAFVRSGGLDDARRQEVQRLERAANDARRRRDDQRAQARSYGGGYIGNASANTKVLAGVIGFIASLFD